MIVFMLMYVGDEKGQVVVWRFAERICFGGCPVQDHIFSMALSYLTESEIAVGWVKLTCTEGQIKWAGLVWFAKISAHQLNTTGFPGTGYLQDPS